MKIILRPHLKIRLKQRKVPGKYPEVIVKYPEEKFFDTETGREIALKRLEYNQKMRPMVVVYDIIEREIQIITIHPVTEQEIQNKVKRKRWIKR